MYISKTKCYCRFSVCKHTMSLNVRVCTEGTQYIVRKFWTTKMDLFCFFIACFKTVLSHPSPSFATISKTSSGGRVSDSSLKTTCGDVMLLSRVQTAILCARHREQKHSAGFESKFVQISITKKQKDSRIPRFQCIFTTLMLDQDCFWKTSTLGCNTSQTCIIKQG